MPPREEVAQRVDRHRVACAFLSVEPLIGAIDRCDFAEMDWVLIGGESGPRCRPMQIEWLNVAVAKSRKARAAIWVKQYGQARNNPAVVQIMAAEKVGVTRAFALAVERGLELCPHEKGGATLEGTVYHELPTAWHELRQRLADQSTRPA